MNRARLWLRSERAFGLNSVSLPRGTIHPGNADRSASPDPTEESVARRQDVRTIVQPAQRGTPVDERPVEKRTVEKLAFTSPAVKVCDGALPQLSPRAASPFGTGRLPSDEKQRRLAALDETEVRGCTLCRLCETRTNTVFGEGDVDAKVFFIGEGPGENEDLQGRPFVGKAGEQLNKWIAAMGLHRDQVYIANIVKCRPPGNRVPMPDEVATCTPYLERQLEIIAPSVIVTLGLPSLKYMTGDPKLTMGRSRGNWRQWRTIRMMPTFHPAYVLRCPTAEVRGAVWSDLKLVMAELGLPLPQRG